MQTAIQDLQIMVNGLSVSYLDEGSSEVPILFVHGFPFEKSSWQYQIDGLKGRMRVLAYDLRGFGKSESSGDALSIDLFADDLVDFMDVLKIDTAIVCGMSMGGYIILNALQRYPDRFAAAVLSNTQCIADSEEARKKRTETIEDINNGGKEVFADAFLRKIFTEESLSSKHGIVQETKQMIMGTSNQSLTATLLALAQRKDTCSVLKEIVVPVLVLCGREDQTIDMARSLDIDSELTISTLHVIEGASHMAQMEQPEMFNRYIREFVGKYKLLASVEF